MSKVGFDGKPFGGRSLRLLDFMWERNVGLPESIYFAQIVGASVNPGGRYFEYTSGFDRAELKPKGLFFDLKDSDESIPGEFFRPEVP